jgi:hypothetical protein
MSYLILTEVQHSAYDRVPYTTSTFIITVKVQLVARGMRPAVCPPLWFVHACTHIVYIVYKASCNSVSISAVDMCITVRMRCNYSRQRCVARHTYVSSVVLLFLVPQTCTSLHEC